MDNHQAEIFPFLTRKMLAFEHGTVFQLRLVTQSSRTGNIYVRGMTREGTFTFKNSLTNDGDTYATTYNIPDIPIWVTVMDTEAGLEQGECFVSLDLVSNGDILLHLLSGYVYFINGISWPSFASIDRRPGGGIVKTPAGTNPAANTEIEETVPNGRTWKFMSAIFTLVTDANAANRQVYFKLTNGTNDILKIPAPAVQTASTTVLYNFGVALPFTNNATALIQTAPLADGLLLLETYTVGTQTTARQVGDNYGAPVLMYEEYLSRP